jgi:signal transduction histidine kinase
VAPDAGPPLDRLTGWLARVRLGSARHAELRSAPRGEAADPAKTGERWDEILRVQELTLSLLSSKVTPDELFRHVVDGAADSLSADEASLMLVEADELRVASSTRTRAGEAATWQQRSRLGEGVAGWVAQTGSPVLLSEGDDLSRFPNLTPKGGRIQSAVSVPLEVGGRVVGVLNANRLGGPRFTSSDLAVLRLFASTAALAIDQASLLQRAQARTRAVEALLAVVDAFVTGAEPARALHAVMPRLATAFRPTQALAFLAPGAERTALPAVAGWDTGPLDQGALEGTTLRLTDEFARLLERGQPAWVASIPLTGAPAWIRHTAAPWLMLPIRAGEASPRCLLALTWDEPGFELPSEELRVLEGLAGQIGVALAREDRAAVVGALQAQVSQARTHLVEVERLATIGQSMAGLVHDINAPLTAAMTLAQMIQSDPATDGTSRERSGQIIVAAQRAQRLIRELLTMAKPRPPAFEPLDLNALVKQTMDLERPQCSVAGIKLVSAFQADLPRATADPHRLGQVLMNLLANARQAMEAAEKGQSLTVQTRQRGNMVEIRVVDDGPGIPEDVRAKIFDWFFTTKPPGEGTGLGLAVSREILQAHGGNLRLEDTPGGGATFVLEIPRERPGA